MTSAALMQSSVLKTAATLGSIAMALLVIRIRTKAAKKPANLMKIIMPPVGMSTGFLMFLFPETHIPLLYALAAVIVGVLFSVPLIRTSHFEQRDGAIYLQRSKAFVFILLGLLVLRVGLHSYIENYVSLPQTGAIFFTLAFCMLLPWRVAMLKRFLAIKNSSEQTEELAIG